MTDQGNCGKGRANLQTIMLALLIIAFIVEWMVMPKVNVARNAESIAAAATKLAETVATEKRITVLEEGQKYTIEMLKTIDRKVDLLDGKVERHVAGK